VALGTAAQSNGGLWADLVGGMGLVVDGDWDYTGTVADPRLKPQLLLATDTTGRPILVDTTTPGTNMAAAGTLIGSRWRTPAVSAGSSAASPPAWTPVSARSAVTGRRPPTAWGWTSPSGSPPRRPTWTRRAASTPRSRRTWCCCWR